MIIKNQALKNYDGNDIENTDLKTVLITCLNHETEKLKPTAEQKMRAYSLSIDLMKSNEVELKSEDIVFIKARLLNCFTALVYGQVIEILEP